MVNSSFAVRQLQRGAGQGLFESLKSAVKYMGVTGWESKPVGFGCDGTNANIGERGGLKGHLKEAVPCSGVVRGVLWVPPLLMEEVLYKPSSPCKL